MIALYFIGAIALIAVLFYGQHIAYDAREKMLLHTIKQMDEAVLLIYHCNQEPRCLECWTSAKRAHDLAVDEFKQRDILGEL